MSDKNRFPRMFFFFFINQSGNFLVHDFILISFNPLMEEKIVKRLQIKLMILEYN